MSAIDETSATGSKNMLPVMLSAIQHYAYCSRQCALIHIEQQFAQNLSTQRGNAVHATVDQPESVVEKGVRVERALPLYSIIHGLIGKADVVEWHGDIPYPVEYKHGPRKTRRADELQVTAQALCLEEMTGHPVPEGAIYHYTSRRRRIVAITPALKAEVLQIVDNIREMMIQTHLPPAVNDSRCEDCSLHDICQPEAVAERDKIAISLSRLFKVEEDEP